MHPATKLSVTLLLLVLLGGLGAADYLLAGGRLTADVTTEETEGTERTEVLEEIEPTGDTRQNEVPEETGATTPGAETGETVLAPAGAVAKNQGITVEQAAQQEGFTMQDTAELTLLSQIITENVRIRSAVLLKDGDRAGSVAWVESPDVKNIFVVLKDSLITAFSPQMRDLRDETLQETGAPVRNILTFLDPSLSEERILFVRVRERLFEFHIASKQEEAMQTFVDRLTTR